MAFSSSFSPTSRFAEEDGGWSHGTHECIRDKIMSLEMKISMYDLQTQHRELQDRELQ
jgi:hypothetical protein